MHETPKPIRLSDEAFTAFDKVRMAIGKWAQQSTGVFAE
jgi:hypothetical protein